ncbi:hypothetical protein GE09DRAFT_1217929 [Coniochaeta sp. 2T2.1]|nr:hypothetical protein GE09DRAFT_1217929 [Coniochaeta sp. 2T2.1]
MQSQNDSLRQELAQAQAEYIKDLEAWKAKQFTNLLGDLQQEAAVDVDRFLARYFLEGQGKPDRTKSTEALGFTPARFDRNSCDCGCGWGYKTQGYSHVILGWDAKAVDIKVARIEAEIRREKEEEEAAEQAGEAEEAAKQNKCWERIFEPHRQYVARKTPSPGPLRLEDLPGSYIARCDGVGGEYSYPYYPRDSFTLDIFEKTSAHGVKATFKMGLWEGIMLLGKSRRSVELLREEQQPKDGDDEDNDEDEDEDEDDEENPISRSNLHGATTTGQNGSSALFPTPRDSKDPNIVYLQFGYNEVNGYHDVDRDNEHVGWLDFDASKLSATGSMSMPAYTEEPQLFTIYKVADKAVADVKDIRE